MNQDQLNKIRMAAGLAPKYDRAEREHLAESAKKSSEKNTVTEAANNRAPATAIADIARRHLNIRNLSAQNKDDLDFHDVSVWNVEAALKAAYKAGFDAGVAKKVVKEGDESKAQVAKAGIEFDPKGGERYPEKDKVDPDVEEKVEKPKAGKSAEGYKTPKNKTAKEVTESKKAKKDYDGDGKVETEAEEHKGVVDKAIKKAKKEKEEMSEGKKLAKKDYDKDGKVETSAEEHRGVVDKAIKKSKREKMEEAAMGDDMKQRRLDLIRQAAQRVQGGDSGDVADVVGDIEPDEEDSIMGDLGGPEEYRDEEDRDEGPEELSGELSFGGNDFEFEDEDCEYAMSVFQPEDEEAYAAGFDAFRKGHPEPAEDQGDYKSGYETARMTRMSSVAEASSEGYNNPKGKKLKADPKSGANAKLGCQKTDKPHKDNITGAKPGLKKIGEAAEDATVFDKDYHHPAGANGHWDMAQHSDDPHVQVPCQMDKVKVPADIKTSLRKEIDDLREDASKVRYRDQDRADFYENTADAFELLLRHLEEGTRHALLLAQVDMNRVMSPMVERLPRDVYMYIVRGGKPAALNELFREVKVKREKGVDPSKEDYTK